MVDGDSQGLEPCPEESCTPRASPGKKQSGAGASKYAASWRRRRLALEQGCPERVLRSQRDMYVRHPCVHACRHASMCSCKGYKLITTVSPYVRLRVYYLNSILQKCVCAGNNNFNDSNSSYNSNNNIPIHPSIQRSFPSSLHP